MYLSRYAFSSLSARAHKGGLGNKIRDIEGEFLQSNSARVFFSTCVTWKLTVNRPAERRKGSNKKDIYRRRALSSLLNHSRSFGQRGSASTSWSAVDADWLTIAPCIKLRSRLRIYPCTLSPPQFYERVLPRAPLVMNSSSALTSVFSRSFDLIRRVLHSSPVYTADTCFSSPRRSAPDVPRSALPDCISNKSRVRASGPARRLRAAEITGVWKTCPPVSIAFGTERCASLAVTTAQRTDATQRRVDGDYGSLSIN